MFEYEDIKPSWPGEHRREKARCQCTGPPTIHLDSDHVFCLIPAFLSDK